MNKIKDMESGFTPICNELLRSTKFTASEKLVMAYRQSLIRQFGKCDAKPETIALAVGMSTRQIDRILKKVGTDKLSDKLSSNNDKLSDKLSSDLPMKYAPPQEYKEYKEYKEAKKAVGTDAPPVPEKSESSKCATLDAAYPESIESSSKCAVAIGNDSASKSLEKEAEASLEDVWAEIEKLDKQYLHTASEGSASFDILEDASGSVSDEDASVDISSSIAEALVENTSASKSLESSSSNAVSVPKASTAKHSKDLLRNAYASSGIGRVGVGAATKSHIAKQNTEFRPTVCPKSGITYDDAKKYLTDREITFPLSPTEIAIVNSKRRY